MPDLATLLKETPTLGATGAIHGDVASLCYDSRRAGPGSVFVAMPGEKTTGTEYVAQAIEKGAFAIVAETPVSAGSTTVITVPKARVALADLATAFYQHPSRGLKVAGVTGTNGKTTTTFLIKHICEQALLRCGLLGTVRYEIGEQILPASRTTPEALEVQELLWRMANAGCKAATLEVSSHALEQERVRGVEFDVAVFTNLTQDHLDYHRTMEAYFAAKERLFSGLLTQKNKKGVAVINADDRFGGQLAAKYREELPVLTYGLGIRADFRASNIRSDFNGTSFQLDARERSYLVRLPLIGNFNVYNALAALAATSAMGVEVRTAVLALASAVSVPGRLEGVAVQRAFKIFVDYAHTDDALINVMKTLRELKPARLLVVFGCGGNRDKSKRPRMGAAVDQLADFALVTSDNPRHERPEAIIEDILPGMPRGRYEVVLDRREAIFQAVEMAQARDIILIAGKGHETYQEVGDQKIPFDDVAIARSALERKRADF